MPLSVIIVDDEQLARDELSYLLRDIEDLEIIGQGKNGVEAVNLIKETSPDLVFLDVQMPGLDGFGVIKKLLEKKIPLPGIVFSTAFDQYAVKAFEVSALDYILKPFDKKRVVQAVEKARKSRRVRRSSQRKAGHPGQTAGAAKAPNHKGSAQGQQPPLPGRPERNLFCLHRRRRHYRGGPEYGRPVELPHSGRAVDVAGREPLLARTPLLSR